MKLLFVCIIGLYGLFIAFYFCGDELNAFFTDKVALIQAEASKVFAENQTVMIKNGHEKDLVILDNQQRREMSALFNSRLLSWTVIIFMAVMIAWLISRICKQNEIFALALANSQENLQKTAIKYKKIDKLADSSGLERIS